MSFLYQQLSTLFKDLERPAVMSENGPDDHPTELTFEYINEEQNDAKISSETGQTTRKSLKEHLSQNKEYGSTILSAPLELPFAQNYKPIPYTFRIPSNSAFPQNKTNWAICPPFHVQLDHTLAVLWNIFSNDKTQNLGVAQLQWALKFLKCVHDENDKVALDVSHCISTIEEMLIQKYAVMADTVKPPTAISAKTCFKNQDGYYLIEEKSEATLDFKLNDSKTIIQKLPFSVNYADMTKGKQNNICNFLESRRSACASLTQTGLNNKNSQVIKSTSSVNLTTSRTRNIMVEFLNAWRREQIVKIQEELRRLHSIETFIGNVTHDTILKPYLDTIQLDYLVEQVFKNLKSESNIPTTEKSKIK